MVDKEKEELMAHINWLETIIKDSYFKSVPNSTFVSEKEKDWRITKDGTLLCVKIPKFNK